MIKQIHTKIQISKQKLCKKKKKAKERRTPKLCISYGSCCNILNEYQRYKSCKPFLDQLSTMLFYGGFFFLFR